MNIGCASKAVSSLLLGATVVYALRASGADLHTEPTVWFDDRAGAIHYRGTISTDGLAQVRQL